MSPYGDLPSGSILLVGDSHILAMGANKNKNIFSLSEINGQKNVLSATKISGVDDSKYWDFVCSHAMDKIIILCWRGNQHNSNFLFQINPSFDFYIYQEQISKINHESLLIPQSVVRKYFDASISELSDILDRLKSAQPARIVVTGTPAPKGDPAILITHIQRSPHFLALARKRRVVEVTADSLTPASVRQKLWLLLQRMMEEAALHAGCDFIPVPASSLLPDGTLLPDYWSDDVTHANTAYGQLALAHFLERLGQSAPIVEEDHFSSL